MNLSEEELDAIAERAAEKTLETLIDHFQKEGGKFFFGWVAKILFGAAIAIVAWEAGKRGI